MRCGSVRRQQETGRKARVTCSSTRSFRSCLLLRRRSSIRLERSTDQVIKPINLEALSKWVGQIPADVVADMADVAPMLSVLGYDPKANPPDYGKPDAFVMTKMHELRQQASVWKEKETELLKIRESIRQNILQQKGSPAIEPADNPSDNEIAAESSAINARQPGTS